MMCWRRRKDMTLICCTRLNVQLTTLRRLSHFCLGESKSEEHKEVLKSPGGSPKPTFSLLWYDSFILTITDTNSPLFVALLDVIH